ncbi:hypothetical protein SMAC4_03464 [Sordaria macrospora]|uniref:WGS project CABT00000000 data, contig 2.10 n=2 Tax=Sordaria macrospora TaxID=5147 RepID=F7VW86_SORMK|nr:uncharacterized protein SMAC_03464 [Sordaria macrospora k-hell]KAH7629880.1 hypothetical protein B0T09DRAFT_357534 [Sordaria sp. MPI-SDFR-AT-0083]WPJ66575.1 hypothetical protein SMAC4_03464 [Sordaria macrospora]CCC09908.1 unnamed protein product [Sordaria macrospora k-hell]
MAPKETKHKPAKKSHPTGGKPKVTKPQKPPQRKPPTSQLQTPKPPLPLPTTALSSSGLPSNWPPSLPYLTAPLFSPLLTPSHYTALRTRPPPDSIEPLEELPGDYVPGPCSNKAIILPITDKRHPAYGQAGLFAARDLKPGEFVVRYLGEIHPGGEEWGGGLVFPEEPKEEEGKGEGNAEDGKMYGAKQMAEKQDGDQGQRDQKKKEAPKVEEQEVKYNYKQSDYDLWLSHVGSPSEDLAVDAARAGNEARFVNDYRGIPNPAFPPGYKPQNKKEELLLKRPNAEFKVVWDPLRQEKTMAVYVLPAGKKATGKAREVGIERGAEVVVSYGKGFWEKRRQEEMNEEIGT